MADEYFEFDGMRIAYTAAGQEHAGEAPPLVFLHNAGASRHLWSEQIAYFGEEHPVYALDLFGYGDSDVPDSGYSVARYRDMLAAFLTHAGLDGPVLVGNCLGSAIVAHLLRSDDRPAGAVLMNPLTEQTARHGGYGWLVGPSARIPRPVRNAVRRFGSPRPAARRVVGQWFSDPSLADRLPAARQLIDGMRRPGGLAALGETIGDDLGTLARLDIEGLPASTPPICTIWGVENTILSSEAGRTLNEKLAPVRQEWLLGCGHAAMLERPDRVSSIIEEFVHLDLARHRQREGSR
ncbi:putative hydrolase [Gordonia araii NBRC 100433]|uniref:Putative hydrolase n=1 Tax=Gordonia araii NBRC 100433 TaxID=1073574 RepID=G7H2X0_9ACTN|nr:alpha/beta hydrolase [Gordonia araii]NNG98321.1 alpha/beta hydrolase [Gordonia araii NBRC 100433]GAB10195.1 putative hydrolase [Gordonia araii NBRC 100433]